MVGVTIIGLLVITYVTGTIQLNLPTFSTTASVNSANWFAIMNNLSSSAQSAFALTGVVPMVIGAGLIIGILISVFDSRKE